MSPDRSAVLATAILVFSALAAAAQPLFPDPLHLTREVADPLAGTTVVVEEYYSGDRAVSIAGGITAIADYARGEIVRIDRARATWSIARFDDLARASRSASRRPGRSASRFDVRPDGTAQREGARVFLYRAATSEGDGPAAMVIAIDHSIGITRAAAEVIAGAAWPNERTAESDAILRAAESDGEAAAMSTSDTRALARVGLPIEMTVVWREGDREVRFTNRVTRVGRETAPPQTLEIPRGAREVDDPRLAAAGLLQSLDRVGDRRE